jgi:hypothetical protein
MFRPKGPSSGCVIDLMTLDNEDGILGRKFGIRFIRNAASCCAGTESVATPQRNVKTRIVWIHIYTVFRLPAVSLFPLVRAFANPVLAQLVRKFVGFYKPAVSLTFSKEPSLVPVLTHFKLGYIRCPCYLRLISVVSPHLYRMTQMLCLRFFDPRCFMLFYVCHACHTLNPSNSLWCDPL